MRKILSVLSILLFLNCKEYDSVTKTVGSKKENNKHKVKENALPFYDFDQVDHFHKSISQDEWFSIVKKDERISVAEIKLLNLLNNRLRVEFLNDTTLVNDIRKFYPDKREVAKADFKTLSNIYSEKYHGDYPLLSCVPFYRDILIFKKDNKVVGISKICFDCQLHSTIGTKRNTEQLGQEGDYKKLQEILN